ncbi:MAG: type VI secretion system contractile sheath large subunit [Myxococcales bacterium]|nr:type VI secretion system contractile sheath large subunit [Myxococcales bacterium]
MSDEKTGGGIAGFGIQFGSGSSAKTAQSDPVAEDSGLGGPFRIVVVSQVTAGADYSTGADPVPNVMRLNRSDFDRTMSELAPSFSIEVETALSDKPLRVDLRWERMKSLKPQSIIDQVPALRSLIDDRRVLQNLVERRIDRDAARIQLSRVLPDGRFNDELCRDLASASGAAPGDTAAAPAAAAPAAAPAPTGSGALDSLLEQVDIATPQQTLEDVAPGAASSLIAAVVKGAGGTKGAVLGNSLDRAISRVESTFTDLLDAIFCHPETQRLEATWRGLWLLLENANTGAGVEIDLIPVCEGHDKITQALTILARREGIHEAERAPVDMVIVDATVGSSQTDLKALEAWSVVAEVLRAPLVTGASHELVGVDKLEDLAYSERRHTGTTDPRAVAARAIAGRDSARWVCLALNRVLVRAAYTTETSRSKEIPFGQDAKGKGHVFAGAYWVIASRCADSYVRTGLGTAMTGGSDGLMSGLPVHEIEDRGEHAAIPVETFISSESQAELARAGITSLGCARNRDMAILSHATTFYREPSQTGGDAAPASASLADQLFVGRFSHAVEMVAAAIPAHASPNAAADVARIALADFFKNPPPVGPEIDAKARDGLLEVTVRPRRFAGIGLSEVTLAAPLAQ